MSLCCFTLFYKFGVFVEILRFSVFFIQKNVTLIAEKFYKKVYS